MEYSEIVRTIKRIIAIEHFYYPDEKTDSYRWYLGFEVVKMLRDYNNLTVNPRYIDEVIAPTLLGISIIIDYENPDVIKLFKECKGV